MFYDISLFISTKLFKKNINKDRFENNINKKISKQFLVSFSK